jgi:hypothetical protein
MSLLLSAANSNDAALRYAVMHGCLLNCEPKFIASNLNNVIQAQLSLPVLNCSVVGLMLVLVGLILYGSSPGQMPWVNAKGLAARVSSL